VGVILAEKPDRFEENASETPDVVGSAASFARYHFGRAVLACQRFGIISCWTDLGRASAKVAEDYMRCAVAAMLDKYVLWLYVHMLDDRTLLMQVSDRRHKTSEHREKRSIQAGRFLCMAMLKPYRECRIRHWRE
jgi:hypothetical protein